MSWYDMNLDPQDAELFIKLRSSVLQFINRIDPDLDFDEDYIGMNELIATTSDAFGRQAKETITKYLAENPDNFSSDELEIIESWNHAIHDEFVCFRQLKKHAIFLKRDHEGNTKAYAVLGIDSGIEEALPATLPLIVRATLFPFKGEIVTNQTFSGVFTFRGSSFREYLKASYNQAKADKTIISQLSPVGATKKKLTAAARAQNLAKWLREEMTSIRSQQRELEHFCNEIMPAFQTWIAKNEKARRTKIDALQQEVVKLGAILDTANEMLMFGRERNSAQAVNTASRAVNQALALEKRMQEAEGEPFEEDELPPEEFEAIREELLFEFLEFIRGIDPLSLPEEELEKARADFHATFDYMESGNFAKFKDALARVGADESDANQSAVKAVFRRLARRLHPDRNAEFTEDAKEFWEELQLLKKALNLPALEYLEMKWSVLSGDKFIGRDLKRLNQLQKNLQSEKEQLEEAIDEYADHPMWGSKSTTPSAKQRKIIQNDFDEGIADLEAEVKRLKEEIATFRRKSAQANRSNRAKKKRAKRAKPQRAKSKKKPAPQKKKAKSKNAPAQKTAKKSAQKSKTPSPPSPDQPEGPTFVQGTFDF